MNIVDVASKYFEVQPNGSKAYSIVGNKYDSIVLFPETNTYHRFSNSDTGGIYKFLRKYVGLTHEEAKTYDASGGVVKASLLESLKNTTKSHTERPSDGYDFVEFVGKPGYNDYIKSRNVDEEIAKRYGLEIDGPDVLFPLYNDSYKRIGSIRRYAYAKNKDDRYRTFILHGHDKPCCWDLRMLADIKPNQVVVLVEGTWSVLRIAQVVGSMYPIVPVATMGTNLQPALFNYVDRNKIIAILDNDTGGQRYKKQLQIQRQKGKIIQEVVLNNKGANIYVDDLTDRQMLTLFKKIWNEI